MDESDTDDSGTKNDSDSALNYHSKHYLFCFVFKHLIGNKKRMASKPRKVKEPITAKSILISDYDSSPDESSPRKKGKVCYEFFLTWVQKIYVYVLFLLITYETIYFTNSWIY